MENIQLQPNHKRSFSSSIFLLEKLVEEVREVMTSDRQLLMQEVETDLNEKKRKLTLQAVDEIEEDIARLAGKYQLTKQVMVESHFLNSRKSKAWEILNDSLSKRMNGFGEFPAEMAAGFDADIEHLLKLVNKL
jgi:Rad3-related DNA helicase